MVSKDIVGKIHSVQREVKELTRSKENKYQKYKYFDELQVLKLLKPLFKIHKLVLIFSDDETVPFEFQKDGSQYLVKYLKKLQIISVKEEGDIGMEGVVNKEFDDKQGVIQYQIKDESLELKFWVIGWNNDPAKAKGAAETYAIKYILSKLFLIPVEDETDPDSGLHEVVMNKEDEKKSDEFLKKHGLKTETPKRTITYEQQQKIYDLFVKVRGGSMDKQKELLIEFDKIIVKSGKFGNTSASNFKTKLSFLTDEEYGEYWDFLEKYLSK